ncbi:hypothetical protein ACP4OV_018259 [Aristida adscensionis]
MAALSGPFFFARHLRSDAGYDVGVFLLLACCLAEIRLAGYGDNRGVLAGAAGQELGLLEEAKVSDELLPSAE